MLGLPKSPSFHSGLDLLADATSATPTAQTASSGGPPEFASTNPFTLAAIKQSIIDFNLYSDISDMSSTEGESDDSALMFAGMQLPSLLGECGGSRTFNLKPGSSVLDAALRASKTLIPGFYKHLKPRK